eukprot:Plantae.Rhodophyta-Hildenbrandia_rubra.ctg661.p1 GENE.Plantae.Rhodophyta-Hildenbrandia_rubra.ctg661~~Plantae.Rhodophyta-Hildenbrandia_rubra.ctg661.p1  ORF type:complete len:417 (-),score=69.96 Plantae.Rhodophyta-Hildenbrandia_rubra.ctg661:2652-3902(-)
MTCESGDKVDLPGQEISSSEVSMLSAEMDQQVCIDTPNPTMTGEASDKSDIAGKDNNSRQVPAASTANQQVTMEVIEEDVPEVSLRVKWGREIYATELESSCTIAQLKEKIYELTEVLPKRQKVLGLPKYEGKAVKDDGMQLSLLDFKVDHTIMVIGSREKDVAKWQGQMNADESVVDDFDFDLEYVIPYQHDVHQPEATRRKLMRRVATTEIRIINPPRDGKRLLVLDLDYTLFDCKGLGPAVPQYARPGLHRFLKDVYSCYDIVIWSQTSWRWLEAKITELGMLLNPDYKLCFVMDRTSMFSVTSRMGQSKRTHEVKALEIVWRKFPNRWNAHNTIHVDDLSRNFALNPQSGLKISAYKDALVSRRTDRELYRLSLYLISIAGTRPDFRKLDHKQWKFVVSQLYPLQFRNRGPL